MSNQPFEQPPGEIRISVNGEVRAVRPGLVIREVLVILGIEGERVAVELNRKIVRKADWDRTAIEAGASLEIVTFVGGW